MNANLMLVRRAALGFALVLVLAGCASGPPSTPADIVQRIETAKTPADHEALAVYYTQEANKARENAALHRTMAKSYQIQAASGRGGASMPAHCNAIAQSDDGIAKQFDDMAAAHRQMATMVK